MNEIESSSVEASEELSFPVPSTKDIGWLLVGGGAVGALVTLLRGERDVSDWVLPVGLIGLGSGILLKRRQSHIVEAEQSIMAELDSLDPIARAQVLKTVAQDQIGRLPGLGSSE